MKGIFTALFSSSLYFTVNPDNDAYVGDTGSVSNVHKPSRMTKWNSYLEVSQISFLENYIFPKSLIYSMRISRGIKDLIHTEKYIFELHLCYILV